MWLFLIKYTASTYKETLLLLRDRAGLAMLFIMPAALVMIMTLLQDSTFKVLEEGAATLSKEEAGKLAQRQLKFIQHLQAALIRVENKTYGVCRETGRLIPKERLRVVPHTTLCMDAKKNQYTM